MKSLLSKILLALVSSTVLALLLTTVMSRIVLKQGFMQFLEQQEEAQLYNLAPELAALYSRDDGWQRLVHNPRQWQRVLVQARPEGVRPPDEPERESLLPGDGPPPRRKPPEPRKNGNRAGADNDPGHRGAPREVRALWRRLYLLDGSGKRLAGADNPLADTGQRVAIEVEGRTVGWLGFIPAPNQFAPEARDYLDYQNRALLLSLLISLVLASVLGFILARSIARPVTHLRATVQELTRGRFDARAAVTAKDEIGDLARHVNRMAQTLEKNESARRRWTADIAHELRTPLAVLRGELDAIHDGVRPYSPELLGSLREEVAHLGQMVEDLQTLALSDAGALNLLLQEVDLAALLRQVSANFEDRLAAAGLTLDIEAPEHLELLADAQRLRQLLHNLLENSCRYTHAGGKVRLRLHAGEDQVTLRICDTAPGVATADLERLFDRFYRTEQSRSRATGGSGLGLSICKNIVEAHGGEIRAEAADEGGLCILIRLPRTP